MARNKFKDSNDALEQMKEDWKDHPVLVPLTGSMYVPGKVKKVENIVIDIGTGYYAEKDLACAKDYFKRKVAFVTEQIDKIEILGFEKSKIRDTIMEVMEMKMGQLKSQTQAA